VPRLRRVIESLEAQRGDAYARGPGTTVYADNMALARVIDRDVDGANERVANAFTPSKMTVASGVLPRWELIFGIVPGPNDTQVVRQARIATAFQRLSQPGNYQQILDDVEAALGPCFVQIIHQDPPNALEWWGLSVMPPTPPAPGGWVPPPWYSTTAQIDIQVQQPAGWTEAEFWAAVGAMVPVLDQRLPAWVTWSIFVSEGFVLDSYENFARDCFGS
jgi:hypothetical protein